MALRDEGSMEGLQFTNITIETFFYERVWLGGAEPIHLTALPRTVNTEVRPSSAGGSRCGHEVAELRLW